MSLKVSACVCNQTVFAVMSSLAQCICHHLLGKPFKAASVNSKLTLLADGK